MIDYESHIRMFNFNFIFDWFGFYDDNFPLLIFCLSRKWQPGVTWFTLRMENIVDTTLALTLSQDLVKQIRSERERERERRNERS